MLSLKKVFVVGNSRSGTTMMGRILGRHRSVFTFNELHFFEQLWNPRLALSVISPEEARQLAARLLTIQRDGYYTQGDPRRYVQEAQVIAQDLPDPITPPLVFAAFLHYESGRYGRTIPCSHTPRDVFYLQEILDLYLHAYVVNMIRDPRDVLLSQKNKWRRRSLGAHNMPLKQVFRAWANYHPITISVIWNSAIRAGDRFADHPRVFHLRFEDLLDAPKERVSELCTFIGLEFQPEMLRVPHVGSSHSLDRSDRTGINRTAASRWQRDRSNTADIAICQRITRGSMARHGYVPASLRPGLLALGRAGMSWPIKTPLAFLLNLNRTRNIVESVRKRLGR